MIYKIIRIYQVDAISVSQATKKLLDAVEAHKEEDFHVSDSVRESDDAADADKGANWVNSAKRQILGK